LLGSETRCRKLAVAKPGQQLATLEEICLIPCVETDDLKRAITAYETLARR
jgi:hypothetical protein